MKGIMSERKATKTYTEEEIERRCLEAGIPYPSDGHDWIDELIGIIRVTRGQRDDAERQFLKIRKEK